jgi:hypothetical protein
MMKVFQLIFAFIGGSAAIFVGAKNPTAIAASGCLAAYVFTLAVARLRGDAEESETWSDSDT